MSCAMSQLAVKVDGTLIGNYDMYNNSSVQKTTTISADQKTATTKYNLGNGVSVSQKVVLQGVDTYDISYSVENTDGQAHNIEIRFAFDVMNTPSPNLTDTHRSGTSFTLENDDAKIESRQPERRIVVWGILVHCMVRLTIMCRMGRK